MGFDINNAETRRARLAAELTKEEIENIIVESEKLYIKRVQQLTPLEKEILDDLGSVYNKIAELPNKKEFDMEYFTQDFNMIQQRIMARLARRVHPEICG